MKSLIFNITQSNVKGGMEKVFVDYSLILQNSDFDLVCLTSSKFPENNLLDEAKIKRIDLNIKGHFDILAVIKLFFLIKKYQPSLLIAHNGRSFAVINILKRIFRVKVKTLAVSHGGNVKRLLNFDYVIGVANHIKKNVEDRKFKGIVQTIHNGIEVVDFKAKPKKGKDFTFGMMSRLSKEKNIEIAIEAFADFVKKVNKDSKLVIAGDGEEREFLQKQAQDLGVLNQVEFIGWISDKEDFFNETDLFLQSSTKESFGISIIEAFNYLTPVISSNALGPKEIIKDGKNGFLFKLEKKNDLFLKMKKAFEEKENLKAITKQAHKDLIEKFSFDKMANSLESLIKTIVR